MFKGQFIYQAIIRHYGKLYTGMAKTGIEIMFVVGTIKSFRLVNGLVLEGRSLE